MSQGRMRTAERRAAAAASGSTPPSSKRACCADDDDDDDAEEEETRHFSLGPDARSLDCPICLMPFNAEIYQCKNGHAACGPCCLRINRKCWCCKDEPIGDIRSRPLESLVADLHTACKFFKFRCGQTLKYTERHAHEDACPHAPLHCPFDGCGYRGALLHGHITDDHADEVDASVGHLQTATVTVHKSAPFCVLVKAGRARRPARVFLLLNGGGVLEGRSLSLVCLGPCPEDGDREIKYKMKVSTAGGATTLEATAPCVRSVEGFQAELSALVKLLGIVNLKLSRELKRFLTKRTG